MQFAIKQMRVKRNMKQDEVAKRAGMPTRRYGSYEREERSISLTDAIAIADALEVSLDDLAGREFSGASFADDEKRLIDDYRATDDLHKAFLSEQASNAALQHPKNEGQRYQAAAA